MDQIKQIKIKEMEEKRNQYDRNNWLRSDMQSNNNKYKNISGILYKIILKSKDIKKGEKGVIVKDNLIKI